MNPYLDDTVNSVLGDIVRNYNLSTQPAYNSAMVQSGSFGNSGVDQMNNEAQRQLQTSLGRAASDLRYGDYWNNQNFSRQLFNDAFSQQQQQLGNITGLMSMLGGANQQDLTNATTVQNTPLNYYGQFANQANSFGQGYGTQTNTTNMTGSPLMGALGGMQLGSALGKAWGGSGWGKPDTTSDNIDVGGGWNPSW